MTRLDCQNGATLIELVLAGGVGLLALLTTVQLVTQQSNELRKLKNGIAINSTQVEIQRALLNPGICATNFASPFAIDESQLSNPSYVAPLTQIVANTSGSYILIRQGEPLDPSTPRIRVGPIQVTNVVKIANDSFRFNLNIYLTGDDGRPTVPILIPRLSVRTDPNSPAHAKQAIGCSASSSSGANCRLVQEDSPGIQRVQTLCAEGETLISGGGECLTPGGQSWSSSTPFNTFGYLRLTAPIQSGSRWGWEVDCFNDANNVVRSRAYAYCCAR